MNFSFDRINTDYTDVRNAPPQMARLVEVVLLDVTSNGVGGSAYQLKKDGSFTEEELMLIKQGVISIHEDAFIPLGEVKEVKRHRKQLVMTNDNTVHYHHLIIVRGTSPTLLSFEFLAGLHTLIDALRVQSKIPASIKVAPAIDPHAKIHASSMPSHSKGSHVMEQLPVPTVNGGTVLYAETNRKLYQVQI